MATTSTLRRYWSPTSPTSPSSPMQIQMPASQLPASPPPTQRKRWSGSPALTPGSSTTSTLSPSSSTALSATLTAASSAEDVVSGITLRLPSPVPYTSEHVITYIPPLVDGAGGTLSRWQRANQWQAGTPSMLSPAHTLYGKVPGINRLSRAKRPGAAPSANTQEALLSPYRLLWSDIRCLALATPAFVRLLWTKATTPFGAVVRSHSWSRLLSLPFDDVADTAEALVQTVVAMTVFSMLCAAPVLFFCLPGGLFLVWLLVCMTFLRLASWPLNRGSHSQTGTVYRGPWDTDAYNTPSEHSSDSDNDDSEDDDGVQEFRRNNEKWYFVSGIGATSRSLAKTGPRLAGVFGRPVTLIRPAYTYGALADCVLALLQRLLLPFCALSVPGADTTVYAALRHTLWSKHDQKNMANRIVVLAHNTGATAVAQALVRLTGEIPAACLAQIEVYTFGSLAPDFVLPQYNLQAGVEICHVEHIAHVHDPCARFGVLQSVRHDLAGRYCGGVFVLGGGGGGGTNRKAGADSINNKNSAMTGLGLNVMSPSASTAFGRRPSISRRRSGSPPLAVNGGIHHPPAKSIAIGNARHNNIHANRQHRMSFPLSYQQLQQHQKHQQHQQLHGFQRTAFRRPASATSSTTTLVPQSTVAVPPPTAHSLMYSMEDYLTALFGPEPWSMRPDPDLDLDFDLDSSLGLGLGLGLDHHGKRRRLACDAFFLDAAVHVDYELAEKREMAALAAASASTSIHEQWNKAQANSRASRFHSVAKNAHHRLSWTGLGATAKYGTVNGLFSAGSGTKTRKSPQSKWSTWNSEFLPDGQALLGLEAVRRICKECDGRPGRDVSRLGGYFADAVARHRERFGF
ncbi:hypothetical protein SEPCBS57363_004614 [Sporothrix epigloea]|uniref:Uncharacterized protein n=1 Tax=Sporothrix epigloea TaxID=1892477 RepID=A0ABP0DSZ9_9PEZI